MNVISKAKSAPNHQVTVLSDLENLEASILKLTQMLERVTNYVDSVLVRYSFWILSFVHGNSHSNHVRSFPFFFWGLLGRKDSS